MLRKFLAIGLGLCAPASVWALGLGDIRLDSALNENLVAEIPITVTSEDELSGFDARVASNATFERYGLDRPAFLNNLYFRVASDAAGNPVLKVSSSRAITEPFVTFLLEANWDRGRLLREYTVLLDPPVFNDQAVAAPVQAPRSSQNNYSSGQIQSAPAPRPAPAPAPRFRPAAIIGESYGPIQRNENLWTISQNTLPSGVSINQMMVAIYRANPDAFLGNINLLKEGATLQIPTAESVRNMARSDANQVVVSHNSNWRGGRVSSSVASASSPDTTTRNPRLKLVAPDESVDGQGTDSSALSDAQALLAQEQAANAELSGELDTLREELEDTKRLLNLKNSDLADLQQSLQDGSTTEPVVEQSVDSVDQSVASVDTSVDTPEEVADENATTETETSVNTSAPDPTRLADKPEPVKQAPIVVNTPEPQPSFFDKLIGLLFNKFLWLAIAGLLGLATLFVILRGRKAHEAESWDSSFSPDSDDASLDLDMDLDASLDKVAQETMVSHTGETSEVEYFEDTGTFKPVDFDPEAEQQAADQSMSAPALGGGETGAYPFEDTLAGETGVKLDQADALSEADFHMAYGLYDQAAELITKSVEKEPERADLRMKLVEIYFMWGNKDEFRKSAETVKNMLGDSAPGEWEKVQIMGSQICPGDDLFESTTTSAPVMGDVVDLQLDETSYEGALDFDAEDFGGDTGSDDLGEASDIIDLDLGDALFDSDEAPTAVGDADNVLDFSFDDQEVEEEFSALSTDTDTSSPEDVKEKIEQVIGADTGGEDTEEMDLDQLGIDLDFGEITSVSEGTSGEFEVTDIAGAEAFSSDIDEAVSEIEAGSDEDFDELFAGLDDDVDAAPVDAAPEEVVATPEHGDKLLDTSELKVEMEELLGANSDDLIDTEETSRGIEMIDPEEFREEDSGSFSAEIRALSEDGLDIGDELAAATSGQVDFGLDAEGEDTVLQQTIDAPEDLMEDASHELQEVFAGSDDDTVLASALVEEDLEEVFSGIGEEGSTSETTSMPALSEEELANDTGTSDAITFHGVFEEPEEELELDDFSSEVFPNADGKTQEMQTMDLDVGESVDESSDGTTMRVATSNLALPDNADLAINEVGTKLDLARAYLDMGDPDGARGILEEVIQEGTEGQQQDARQMLEGIT